MIQFWNLLFATVLRFWIKRFHFLSSKNKCACPIFFFLLLFLLLFPAFTGLKYAYTHAEVRLEVDWIEVNCEGKTFSFNDIDGKARPECHSCEINVKFSGSPEKSLDSSEESTTFCQREAGRVNVGFPPPTRHHLWKKKLLQLEVYGSTLISHKGGWNRRKKEKKNMSRYSPILLKLSDKVLLNFFILPIFSAGWEAGIRSHIFFSTSTPTLAEGWQRTGCVLEAGERRTGVPSALRGLLQPSCSALANRKRSLSRLSLLSSTSAANASLRIALKNKTTFLKINLKQKHASQKSRVNCCAFLVAPRFCSVRGIQPQLRLLSFFSLRPSCSLLHRNLDVIFGILSLVSTHRPRPGCEDRRAHAERHVPIRPGDWPSKRQRRPCNVLQEEEYFHGGPVRGAARGCCPLQDPVIVCRSRCSPNISPHQRHSQKSSE